MNTYNKNKLIIGAIIIYTLSIIVMVISLIGMAYDYDNCESYCIVFSFFSLTGVFGLLQYEDHKRV